MPTTPEEHLDRRRVGILGEETAAVAYRRLGYDIIGANFRSPYGEIDLIAQRKNLLVFIEVRTREAGAVITPAQTVDAHKRRRIVLTAQHFLARCPQLAKSDIRFDVVEAFYEGGYRCRLNRIENAFTP